MFSWQNLLEWFDCHGIVHASLKIRVFVGPGFCLIERIKFCNYETTGKTRCAGIITVNGGVRPGEDKSTFTLQYLKPF
tara:strand:- start:4817 stop:5050 length:234 start_codon:yes stop_codon:yes gene_type:complete